MKKKTRKTKKKEEDYEEYAMDDDRDFNVPPLKVDLKVLAQGNDFCLLKDEVSNNVFSVERDTLSTHLLLLKKGRN